MVRKIVFIVVGVLVVGLLAFGVYSFLTRPSDASVEGNKFIVQLIRNDFDGAYARLSSKLQAFDKNYWQERFALFANYQGAPELLKDEVYSSNGSGDQPPAYPQGIVAHKLEYHFWFKDIEYRLSIDMVKDGDQWKINAFDGDYVAK